MATKPGIRHRLLTIVILGVITSALCLAALVRILSITTASRVERARDAVTEASDRLVESGPRGASTVELGTTLIGVRGGIVAGPDAVLPTLPDGWQKPVAETLAASSIERHRVTAEIKHGESTLVVSATPLHDGSLVWAGFLAVPSTHLVFWRTIVIVLSLATALLVATTIYAIVTMNRSAAALNASLVNLATDLSAPVPRPAIRELSDIADGIAELARRLARARDAEEELGRELAQQERLAALGRVVAGVAHEVRNPLASIKLRLDLAAASTGLPEDVARSIVGASSEIDRLDRLVADLLVVAGRAIGPRKEGSLGALVKSRVDALAPWAAEREVDIDVRGDASVPVDSDSLSRAIDNLVRNAVEASKPGETVEVEVCGDKGIARLRVCDHGAGVPGDRASELFEPFFTTKPAGMGLGLALSRSIARAHGGDVTYARVGDATRFEITIEALPALSKPVASASRSRTHS